jgi:hypothetical protein
MTRRFPCCAAIGIIGGHMAILFAPESAAAAKTRRLEWTIRSGGYDWTVHTHAPAMTAIGSPLPLVLVFHGAGGRESVLPERFMGPGIKPVNATDAIWDFFAGSRK